MPARAKRRTAALDLVLPGGCLLCGAAYDPRLGGVCQPCRDALPRLVAPTCHRCGIELISEHGVCTRCRDRQFAFERNVALYPYQGAVRQLIHHYKSGGRRCVADLFASALASIYRGQFEGLPVVPVPGRRSTWRLRGWEHVDLLARRLATTWGVPIHRCLVRGPGPAQKALDYEGRLHHIHGTITMRSAAVAPAVAVLLDDIITTGATLSECASVLREHGAQTVYAMTVAVDE